MEIIGYLWDCVLNGGQLIMTDVKTGLNKYKLMLISPTWREEIWLCSPSKSAMQRGVSA